MKVQIQASACSVGVENFFLYIVSINKSSILFASVIALNFFLYIGWRKYGAILGLRASVKKISI